MPFHWLHSRHYELSSAGIYTIQARISICSYLLMLQVTCVVSCRHGGEGHPLRQEAGRCHGDHRCGEHLGHLCTGQTLGILGWKEMRGRLLDQLNKEIQPWCWTELSDMFKTRVFNEWNFWHAWMSTRLDSWQATTFKMSLVLGRGGVGRHLETSCINTHNSSGGIARWTRALKFT